MSSPFPFGVSHLNVAVDDVKLLAMGAGDTPFGIFGGRVVALTDLGPYAPAPTEFIPATTKLCTVEADKPVTTNVVATLPVFVTTTVGVSPAYQFCTPLTNLMDSSRGVAAAEEEEKEAARGGEIGTHGA